MGSNVRLKNGIYKKIVIVYNPISGQGKSKENSLRLHKYLSLNGIKSKLIKTEKKSSNIWLAPLINSETVLIVVGGDGTVSSICNVVAMKRAILYHLPSGKENLFAKEFGMRNDLQFIKNSLLKPNIKEIDIGICNDFIPMILMCSIGLDSKIVYEVSKNRTKTSSNWTYISAFFRSLKYQWFNKGISVEIDGKSFINNQRGWLIVANCSHYGACINPVPEADLYDGFLDVAFYPGISIFSELIWFLKCRLANNKRLKGSIYSRGKKIRITSKSNFVWQVDGDSPRIEINSKLLDVSLDNHKMRILRPN